jgi:hypothetical protein
MDSQTDTHKNCPADAASTVGLSSQSRTTTSSFACTSETCPDQSRAWGGRSELPVAHTGNGPGLTPAASNKALVGPSTSSLTADLSAGSRSGQYGPCTELAIPLSMPDLLKQSYRSVISYLSGLELAARSAAEHASAAPQALRPGRESLPDRNVIRSTRQPTGSSPACSHSGTQTRVHQEMAHEPTDLRLAHLEA